LGSNRKKLAAGLVVANMKTSIQNKEERCIINHRLLQRRFLKKKSLAGVPVAVTGASRKEIWAV
jgi:hypothetical protein